jgi:hypothetical protein
MRPRYLIRLYLGNDGGKHQRACVRARYFCLAASHTSFRREALWSPIYLLVFFAVGVVPSPMVDFEAIGVLWVGIRFIRRLSGGSDARSAVKFHSTRSTRMAASAVG